jgi:hypothetical protein
MTGLTGEFHPRQGTEQLTRLEINRNSGTGRNAALEIAECAFTRSDSREDPRTKVTIVSGMVASAVGTSRSV